MPNPVSVRWHLLIHSLPARPLYLRARIRRLLGEAGAAPLRKAVYAIPASAEALERLRAVAQAIEAGGGTAFVCEATFPDTATAASVTRAYNDEIARGYGNWSAAVERVLESPTARGARKTAVAGAPDADARRRLVGLRRRLERLRAHDCFAAPGGDRATALLRRAERFDARAAGGANLTGLRWVTRRGLHVDRLACAWVVRRFIDPRARFRFTDNPAAPLPPGEIGFDMPGAAIGHERGGCSMETLIERAGLRDPRLRYVADIVHDIDFKDGRHGHPETVGFEQMLVGLLTATPSDVDRLERSLMLFDSLHVAPSLGSPARLRPTPRVSLPKALRRREPR